MKAILDSINLFARNPLLLRSFYETVLGLEVDTERSHGDGFFLLKAGDCNLLIQDAQKVGAETGEKGFELGFCVDNLEGLRQGVLDAGGQIVHDQQEMGWGQAITAADPEGHLINIYRFV